MDTPNPIEDKPSPRALYTLEEVATYCNRSHQLLRLYMAEGILPEPVNSVKHKRKTTRKFTLAEANHFKNFFDSVKRDSFTPARKRAQRRKKENEPRRDQTT